ncbi:uncharacterized protein SPPG_00704 [Spizellomyces punctatus DAOM BR117]|uniref:SWIRM domain-containing protein n=1 Tax=Spizellomyces punctatus (strain DAOM BR117) TaxID=645134 RepID=A0A0L0HVU8_SPIPD|nr:uncharacterized protein SPPG_00704 [Spizellomyces punctatus DAOM BR117]KND05025.1 hypothetical protein SPPG_00704 [Spizellomyces punctatus DAOM BR117]|eukprot:XP_016613064.1 hypothetical protein SPPG_00704 [Spizellomyces punctatus DAOM BR117]
MDSQKPDINGTNHPDETANELNYDNEQGSDASIAGNTDMDVDTDAGVERGDSRLGDDSATEPRERGDVNRTDNDDSNAQTVASGAGDEAAPNADAGGIDGSGMNVRLAEIDAGPATASKMLVPQSQEIIIPSYTAWFNMSRIHDIEKRSLPEFFNNKNKSKTPSVYKDYRDFMINTYRLNPSEYLTVTACRRNLAGDVCAIIRVHAFLEQWGLVNYQVDADSRPSTVGPAFTGHFRVTADTPRGLQPIYPSVPLLKTEPRTPQRPADRELVDNSMGSKAPPVNLQFSKNIYADAIAQSPRKHALEAEDEEAAQTPPAKKVKHNCATCGVDCTRLRYHSTKTPTMEICTNCYIEGRFPSNMYSGDFIKMEDRPTKQAAEDDWTEQETLLLLEGIELFDEDWNKVADHVGTRTRDQCILKFLQLPIEDPYVGVKSSDLGPLQFHRVPFSAADNPVLSLTAFLASVVDPKVAAAASRAAAEELEKATSTKEIKESKPSETQTEGEDRENITKETASANKQGTPTTQEKVEDSELAEEKPPVPAAEGASHDVNATADAMNIDQVESEAPEAVSTHQPTTVQDGEPGGTRPDALLQKSAATAIASAGAKAHALGGHATSELHALTLALIQTQMRKLEAKMLHFEEMEAVLEHERKEIEREKQRLYMDRLAFRRTVLNWEARHAFSSEKENHHTNENRNYSNVMKGSGFGELGNAAGAMRVEFGAQSGQEVGPLSREGEGFLISIG